MEDPRFWEGAAFATFGGLPSARNSVTVVGFPLGGDTVGPCLACRMGQAALGSCRWGLAAARLRVCVRLWSLCPVINEAAARLPSCARRAPP